MIMLDTNIVSETMRVVVDANTQAWLDRQNAASLYLSWPVIAELRYGVDRMAAGRKQTMLAAALDRIEYHTFAGRILSLDQAAAHAYAAIRTMRHRAGRPMHPMDALIAAIALANSMTLATRNTRDFEGAGLALVNPFETG